MVVAVEHAQRIQPLLLLRLKMLLASPPQEFVELVRRDDMAAAIGYARRHLAQWAGSFEAEHQRAFAVLVFTADTQCARYQVGGAWLMMREAGPWRMRLHDQQHICTWWKPKSSGIALQELFDPGRWGELQTVFQQDLYRLHALTPTSLLNIHLQARAILTQNAQSPALPQATNPHPEGIQLLILVLMTSLLSTCKPPLKLMADGPTERRNITTLHRVHCRLHALPTALKVPQSATHKEDRLHLTKERDFLSRCHLYVQAGLAALKVPQSLEEGTNKEDPLHLDTFRQLAAGLPFSKHVHSKLVCAITRAQMNEHNPPMVRSW